MKKRTRNKLIKLGIFFGVAVIGIIVFYLIIKPRAIYDYAVLVDQVSFGPEQEFTPMPADSKPEHMPNALKVSENETLILYIDEVSYNVAVTDKRNGQTWYAAPAQTDADPIANPMEKNLMRSPLILQYFTERRLKASIMSYDKSVLNEQVTLKSIPDGVRVEYTIGDMSLGINAAPVYLTAEALEEKFLSKLEDESEKRWLTQRYATSKEKEGFLQLLGSVLTSKIHSDHMLQILDTVGYTLEDLAEDNELANYEMNLEFNYFFVPIQYKISGDQLIANIPANEIESNGSSVVGTFDFLRFFGAGGAEEEGYLLVPDGSGALIDFNNGKYAEEQYIGPVYGQDYLMYYVFPQITQNIRMPIFGIKREDAAFVAEITHGSALATIYADVNGRTNSYNNVFANFTLRENEMLNVAGITGTDSDMTVVQEKPYEGNITIEYSFLANEKANYTGMAEAYQRNLVARGVLSPLEETENTPFYVDMLGAIEKQSFFMGVPYNAKKVMTSYEQAQTISEALLDRGVSNIQMQWLGWFNGGVSHHIPKVIKTIGSLGSQKDRDNLRNTLSAAEGELYPAVKFVSTTYKSKNMSQMHEASRSVAGYLGYFTGYNREFLRITRTRFLTDVYQLVHPGMLPDIVDTFMKKYQKQNINTLALPDLADNLTSSLHRTNTVDRESSKLIMTEQMRKLNETTGNLMMSGGNDYSWRYADHIVDMPTDADMHYIVDRGIPFMQMVLHGYIDYTGKSLNTAEVYDPDQMLLTMMAYGASPHYTWTYAPTVEMERTPYDRYYSTQYSDWINQAVRFYQEYNEVYKNLRTQRITDFIIYQEGVSATVFEDGTYIYVNKSDWAASVSEPDSDEPVNLPAKSYFVMGVDMR